MLHIRKSAAPKKLLAYRKTADASYRDLQNPVKREVRLSLCIEQGYLCAYCMRRIEVEDEGDPKPVRNACTIEHYSPQNPPGKAEAADALDYKNMLAVCQGTIDDGVSSTELTCDKSRGNSILTLDPRKKSSMDRISYKQQGDIISDEPGVQEDLDKTLNLNCEIMKENRAAAQEALLEEMRRRFGSSRTWTKADFRKMYGELKSKRRKLEYTGFLLWWLERRIR